MVRYWLNIRITSYNVCYTKLLRFPVEQEDIRHSVIEAMDLMLSDNVKMRVQQSDGRYQKKAAKGKKRNNFV